jgi:hypothetical protein
VHRPAHVGLDGGSHLLVWGACGIDCREPGHDPIEEEGDARELARALASGGERGLDRAASLVAHHHAQRRLQMGGGVLDAAHHRGPDHVAGDADDEQFAEAGVEDELGRHA